MKKKYHLFVLLMVAAVIAWEVGLYSDTVGVYSEYPGDCSAVFYTQAGSDIIDEACTPELIGLASCHANAGIIYIKSPKGRNSLGKLLYTFFILLCSLTGLFSLPVVLTLESDRLRSLSVVLCYMHDQDGKKRLS